MKRLVSLLLVLACLLMSSIATAAPIELADGSYLVDVALDGGTGRASVTSPTQFVVADGQAVATIEWSSPHYDYMLVDGERYLPVNESGNTRFEVPVSVFDEPVAIVADTTAMSTPHEISYELTFSSTSVQPAKRGMDAASMLVPIAIVAAVAGAVLFLRHKRQS